MSRAISLSYLEFDIVWELLDLGEQPYPIDVPSHGLTLDDRDELRATVLAGFTEQGLYDGRDLHPRFEDQLVLLARNSYSVDAHLAGTGYLRVLAAARGEQGVLVVQADKEVRLLPLRANALVAGMIELLPPAQAGPGGAVTMRRAVFSEAVRSYQRTGYAAFESTLRNSGVAGRELRTLVTLVDSGKRGGGQVGANSVDQLGRRTRTPVLNWFDTDEGRYLAQVEAGRDGEEWLTITPADTTRVARRVNELVAKVGSG